MNSTTGKYNIDDNFQLHYRSWPAPAAKLNMIIAHGFAEHHDRYAHVAKFFNAQGINVFAFDFPGHGHSDGKRGHAKSYDYLLASIEMGLKQMSQLFPGLPTLLYAHSMGGNIMLNYLFRKQPEVVGAIITGPWIKLYTPAPAIKVALGKMLRNIIPSMTQPTDLDASLISTDPAVVKAYVDDPLVQTRISNALGIDILKGADYLSGFQGEVSCPILLMHGEKDQIIDPQGSKDLAAKLTGPVTLKICEGLYHEIHNEPSQQDVFNHMLQWINSNILAK